MCGQPVALKKVESPQYNLLWSLPSTTRTRCPLINLTRYLGYFQNSWKWNSHCNAQVSNYLKAGKANINASGYSCTSAQSCTILSTQYYHLRSLTSHRCRGPACSQSRGNGRTGNSLRQGCALAIHPLHVIYTTNN
jgi:hypothetical protein